MRKIINPGIILMLITAGYQSVISALVKAVAHDITIELQVLAYYLIPLFFFIPMFLKNGFSNYKTEMAIIHFCRGLFAVGSVFCFFYASQHLQLGVAAVLFNSSPIFVPLLARILLGEETSLLVYLGILISLTGIIIVIHPGVNGFFSPVAIIGLCSGFLMAVASVMLRYMAKTGEPVTKIVFYLYFMSTLVTILFIASKCLINLNLIDTFQVTGADQYFIVSILVILGVISLIAQRTLTKAFQYMPAGKLMPFLYVSVPISSLIGWIFWNQQCSFSTALGTLFVVAGVIIIMFEINIRKFFNHVFCNQMEKVK